MGCKFQPKCGGCCFRHMDIIPYQEDKTSFVRNLLNSGLVDKNFLWDKPKFLPDGTRRRATFAFERRKNDIVLGFNENKSTDIVPCTYCPLLTPKLNEILPSLPAFVGRFCSIPMFDYKDKKNRARRQAGDLQRRNEDFSKGDLHMLEADNGIDIVLEGNFELGLDHRQEIFDYVQAHGKIIRFSVRRKGRDGAETIMEKLKPYIRIAGYEVSVPPATFLQASKEGEKTLSDIVTKYLGTTSGHIADLFCGVGTFTYPLSRGNGHQITAIDSDQNLLEGFKCTVKKQMIHNVTILQRNLFKYPLTANELTKFKAVIFDPPRAGAKKQVEELARIERNLRPEKIIAVSCNPHTFVNDANVLINSGYKLHRITMVDQFVYSKHNELVALFTN